MDYSADVDNNNENVVEMTYNHTPKKNLDSAGNVGTPSGVYRSSRIGGGHDFCRQQYIVLF